MSPPAALRPAGLAPYAVLAVAPLCWAGNIVLARGVADLIPPVAFAFFRWTLASLLLLPFALRQAARDRHEIRRGWKRLAVLALLGISGFNTLLYAAVHTTTAINGALLQTSMPAVIVLLSLLLHRERVSRAQLAGVLLCIAGAAGIVLRGDPRRLAQFDLVPGDLLMAAAVVLYALYSVLLRRRPPLHPLSLLAATFAFGAAALFPAFLAECALYGAPALDGRVAASVLYVALFPSIVAYFCWNRGIDRLGPNRAGLFINLIPVFAALLSVALLGERVQGFHLAGLALIAGGMILFYRRGGPERRTRREPAATGPPARE